MLNDYTKQAAVWDWDAYDETPEYEYWRNYAANYGKNVLIPMCAHGKTGIGLAERGLYVTAFDLSPEMIAEGEKRYGRRMHRLSEFFPDIKCIGASENAKGPRLKPKGHLRLLVADITDLHLHRNDFDFAFIAGNGDLHLLPSIAEVEKAFCEIGKHLRPGGGLALELSLPGQESWHSPKRVFHPRVPGYTDKKVWKENENTYHADTRQHIIDQTVYIQDENGTESFTQQVCLQLYPREEILAALEKCGFHVVGEYSDREKTPWLAAASGDRGNTTWILEAVKQ